MQANPTHFVSFNQAGEMLGCGRTTIYQYVHSGDLHPVHHGRRSVLSVLEVDQLAKRLARKAGVTLEEVA